MKRNLVWVAMALVCGLGWHPARAEEPVAPVSGPHLFTGVQVGVIGPLAPLSSYAENGVSVNPILGYKFNDYVGLQGTFHWLTIPLRDSDPSLLEDDNAFALGGTVGPRFSVMPAGIELYASIEVGGFTGLSPHSPISDSSWAFNVGGGLNLPISKSISVGGFGRYNRLFQRAHGDGDVRYATGGIELIVKLSDLSMPSVSSGSSTPPPK